MGSLNRKPLTKYQQIFNDKQFKAIIVGLDAAGKTSMLYKLDLAEIDSVTMMGYNLEIVQFQKVKLVAFDLGGNQWLRKHFSTYYQGANAIVFVVDSTDRERLGLASQELHRLLDDQRLKNVILLVLVNKLDVEGMNMEYIEQKMKLNAINGRQWRILGISVSTEVGLSQTFQWLCSKVSKGQ